MAFASGREASLWDLATGEQIKTWRLPEGLNDRLAFPEPNRLLLYRVETKTGKVGPFSNFDSHVYPRVCRVRDLLGLEPIKPLAEIRDCNLHVFGSECSPDGKYYVIDGLGDSPGVVTRFVNLYKGLTGEMLGKLPTQNGVNRNGTWFSFDTTGTVLSFHAGVQGQHSLLLEMPSRAVLRQFDNDPSFLGPQARQWLRALVATVDQPAGYLLFDQDHQEPLIKFVLDPAHADKTFNSQFSPDGLYLVWGNLSGAVTVVDLVEVRANWPSSASGGRPEGCANRN